MYLVAFGCSENLFVSWHGPGAPALTTLFGDPDQYSLRCSDDFLAYPSWVSDRHMGWDVPFVYAFNSNQFLTSSDISAAVKMTDELHDASPQAEYVMERFASHIYDINCLTYIQS